MKFAIVAADEENLNKDYMKDSIRAVHTAPCEEKGNVLKFHIYALK